MVPGGSGAKLTLLRSSAWPPPHPPRPRPPVGPRPPARPPARLARLAGWLQADENMIIFHTKRYNTSPLIVKGAASGPELLASAVFSDMLRLARTFSNDM